MIIAEVYINQLNFNLDRPFDYFVPDELIKDIKLGQRVMVPFGIGNKYVDGIVFKLKKDSNFKKLKRIKQILDEESVLNSFQIKLCSYMKEKYFCFFMEGVQLFYPSGTKIKKQIKYKLSNKDFKTKNDVNSSIINLFKKNDYILAKEQLESLLSDNKMVKNIIRKLIKEKIIYEDISFILYKNRNYEKYLMLSGKYNCLEDYYKQIRKQATKQKKILETLSFHTRSYSELKEKLNINNSHLKPLLYKELIVVEKKRIERNPYLTKEYIYPKVELSDNQNEIINIFKKSIHLPSIKYLLHGVTGSGKTEIYLNMIDEYIKKGKQCLILIPEISLASQMVERVYGRFPEQVAIYHSKLSDGEKLDQWEKIKNNTAKIVLGTRSAIFTPFNNLGLIIIDEEHENTYKSSNRPRYHVREIAKELSQLTGCQLVLGSATPSIESYYKAIKGEYKLLSLPNRINNIPMPKVNIIDMRDELNKGNYSIISEDLLNEIKKTLNKKEQIILFLNRRGYSTYVFCRSCGYVAKCPNCDVTLTYHKRKGKLECHYCGYIQEIPRICPECNSKKIKYFGSGTQKIEEEIKRMLPEVSILRMDADTTVKKDSYDKIISNFKNGKGDILIGTQMVTKGFDFKNVTLVGIILADTLLNLPDFKASERTFQLTTQVAGRSGRGSKLGKVIMQTYEPQHYSILCSKEHDYIDFYYKEITFRKSMNYPPFSEIVYIGLQNEESQRVEKEAIFLYNQIIKIIKTNNWEHLKGDIYFPTCSPIGKINNRYRWQLIIKTKNIDKIKKVINNIYTEKIFLQLNSNIVIDFNPITMI